MLDAIARFLKAGRSGLGGSRPNLPETVGTNGARHRVEQENRGQSGSIARLKLDVGGIPVPRAPSDVLACDREPIHIPGRIQSYGFLLALTRDWVVAHVSANIGDFTGHGGSAWLGRPIADLFGTSAVHTLRNQIAMLHGPDAVQRSFALCLIEGGPAFDVAVHLAGAMIVIEAEPAIIDEREAAALVRAMVARLKHSDGLSSFFRDGARHVQALTGFNRVMIYRFDDAGHGEVVAEALRGSQASYMGLHYPASDIPAQARLLYLRSPFRIIADVAAATVALETVQDPTERLDQSLSVLRAVSPVHIEYLKNMGVAASLSISIVVDGRLWGLFACHHGAARLPSFAYRTAAELFGEMFSMMLEGRLRRDTAKYGLRAQALATLLKAEFEHDGHLLNDAGRLGELILDTIPADGLGIQIGGASWLTGKTPTPQQCLAITSMLADQGVQSVFATASLCTILPEAAAYTERTAGLIAIPLMQNPEDFLLLFRGEQVRTIQWAGDPDKTAAGSEDGRLSPRRSFAAWAELVRGKCSPFTTSEQNAAETIRVALLESQLRAIGKEHRPDPNTQPGHDILISELNHRVRNILALIRGLISQTRGSAETAETFMATLDERVQSLARAHNQVTSDRWGPARLTELIMTEAAAYLGIERDRVTIDGANILIEPAAFTTLALVFHELMTNAAKYGSLSGVGTVVISWRIGMNGDLVVDWQERGGPVVSPPTRRGFGSTIIERSIPFDLGGAAALEYRPTGLEARFHVPARHLAGLSSVTRLTAPAFPIGADYLPLLGRSVLLVEDTMIVALDCESTLRELGATNVTIATSVTEALAALASEIFDVALLDFNLGLELSVEIADVLAARAIPFAFATGYDGDLQHGGHANAPVIGKPYGRNQLVPVLSRLGFGQALPGGNEAHRPA